jgi:hypothetical protein
MTLRLPDCPTFYRGHLLSTPIFFGLTSKSKGDFPGAVSALMQLANYALFA